MFSITATAARSFPARAASTRTHLFHAHRLHEQHHALQRRVCDLGGRVLRKRVVEVCRRVEAV
eukprot:363997-Chlamydomonas_euryale.AAC.1